MSEIQELKNHNAGLIEDHTRDVLSIKAKETQLVRARSDTEAAEATNERLRRELDRLKRALGKAEAFGVAGPGSPSSPNPGLMSPTHDDAGIYRDGMHQSGGNRNRMSFNSTLSEEKENGETASYPRSKLSPELRYAGSTASSGRGSPARGFRRDVEEREPRSMDGQVASGFNSHGDRSNSRAGSRTGSRLGDPTAGAAPPGNGVESWKRAAEVTSQLKARIEQMKVCLHRQLLCQSQVANDVPGEARHQAVEHPGSSAPPAADPLPPYQKRRGVASRLSLSRWRWTMT
jgi:cytoskeleton-associated protein 5